MSTGLRRTTYIFFILLFIILTPILIFNALGYKYNFDTGIIEKSGAFYVKSFPRGAQIQVNGNLIDDKTPTQVTKLSPGTYTLTVLRDQFVPWTKTLPIQAGQTTFAEDIVLFLENIEKTDLGNGSDKYIVNNQEDKYAYIDENLELFITDVEQEKNLSIFNFDKSYDFVSWSNDNQKMILKDSGSFYLFNINQKNIELLNIPINSSKVSFDNIDNDQIWYLTNGELFKLNINQVSSQSISQVNLSAAEINEEILDIETFDIIDNYLVILYNINGVNILEQYNKANLSSQTQVPNVNLGELDVLKADQDQIIFKIGSLLHIQRVFRPITEIQINTAEIHDQRILMTNGNEIILYQFEEDWQDLIDRSTQQVSDIFWHPNGSYFISEVNGVTNIIEIDGRDKRNIVQILDDPVKKKYLFNKKGDKLFVLTPTENFFLTIQ